MIVLPQTLLLAKLLLSCIDEHINYKFREKFRWIYFLIIVEPAYSLIFTQFNAIEQAKDFVTSFSIRSDHPPYPPLNGHLRMIFVELVKFQKETPQDLVDFRDYWCYIIKKSGKLNSSEWDFLSQFHKDLKGAMDHLKTLSNDQQIRLEEEMRDKYIRDQRAREDFRYEKGLEKGLEDVALRMLESKVDISFIQEMTGLSQSQIQEIQKRISK